MATPGNETQSAAYRWRQTLLTPVCIIIGHAEEPAHMSEQTPDGIHKSMVYFCTRCWSEWPRTNTDEEEAELRRPHLWKQPWKRNLIFIVLHFVVGVGCFYFSAELRVPDPTANERELLFLSGFYFALGTVLIMVAAVKFVRTAKSSLDAWESSTR